MGCFLLWVGVALAASPHRISLPPERAQSNLLRDGALFLLDGVSSDSPRVANDQLELDATQLPAGFLEALAAASTAGEVYSAFKKPPFRSHYAQRSRTRFHSRLPIPNTLAEFEQTYGFRDPKRGWNEDALSFSDVKGTRRHIFRAPAQVGEISVAQTIVRDRSGREFVRETEVIARREGQEHFDFYVYASDGTLADESEFASVTGKKVVGPVPITCMACHYDRNSRTFTREAAID